MSGRVRTLAGVMGNTGVETQAMGVLRSLVALGKAYARRLLVDHCDD